MFKLRYLAFILLLITAASSDVYAQKYVQISTEKQSESKDIIIYEFFWYGCPHCFNLEPTIDRIEADLDTDAKIVKVPVALRDSWMPHAKLYYALSQMNEMNARLTKEKSNLQERIKTLEEDKDRHEHTIIELTQL